MIRDSHNFIRGMGSALNLVPCGGPSRVGQGIDMDRSDAEALSRDWQRVAQDLGVAYRRTTKEADEHVQSKQAK